MKLNFKNVFLFFIFICILYLCFCNVYAVDMDFWGDASTWFGKATFANSNKNYDQTQSIINVFQEMIKVVGTTVIVIATIVLGIKYIIGSVDSKVDAKEGLITLFVACVFFFGWSAISELLFPNNNFVFTSYNDTTYKNMVGRIFDIFAYVANIVAIILVIYVGVKYIFAGANGKGELKGRSVYFFIGIILVFATSNVLSFVSKVINDILIR